MCKSSLSWKRVGLVALTTSCCCLALALSAQTPKNVILFVGDGMGFEHVKAARYYNGAPLSFETLPAQGRLTTRAANNPVTDSAAAATAMATGFKVNTGVISVALPGNGSALETTLEYFKKQGKSTGLVTTSYLTDATPGAFGAHESSRTSTSAIGMDFLTQTQPNILFGGGGNGLEGATAEATGYQVAVDKAGFEALNPASAQLCAAFGTGYMPYEEDSLPSGTYPYPHLREMVAKALDALEHNPNGFFLLVEAGRIDHAAGTGTLAEMIHETLELSRSVQVATNWIGSRTDTQLIVLADHETGGLTVTTDNGTGNLPGVTWSSAYSHTAADVPVYAFGVDAGRVVSMLDNTYIHSICTGEALSVPATVTLVPAGATWKYEASGSNLGTDWRDLGFDDSGWASGPAQLGYGDGDEATRLPATPVQYCYYFRHTFDVTDPAAWSSLSLEILRDDGAVVYLNGQEVARYNMPAGTIAYTTLASSAGEFPSWDAPLTIPNLLFPGANVIAVEIHQAALNSTDISLDLKLTGNVELAITPNSPIAGATGVPNPATLTATPSDPAGHSTTVEFYGRQVPPSVPDFSIVVLPDTQNYTAGLNGGTPQMFAAQTQWIVNNRQSRNIAYVAHLGDISNDGDSDPSQWINAQTALNVLDSAGIPYGLAVGNHDELVPAGDTEPTTSYNYYYGAAHFSGRNYYGGHFGGNNNNHYEVFSASGLDFIVIYFEYDTTPDPSVLDWADGLLKANPTRRGIVVSHYLIDGSGAWGAQGQAIYNALSDNPNLFFMLGGHISGESRRTDSSAGNAVHTLLSDYQGDANGGNGFLRILRFSPNDNQVYVETYSPVTEQSRTADASQFALSYTMQTGGAFQLVKQDTGVTSGTATTATWSGLIPGAEYEWFAVATDGPERAISETRRFTTLANELPTVTITSPVDGASFDLAPANVSITAAPADSDGTVTNVEFFVGSNSAGSVTATPYTVSTNLPSGAYVLTAVATDDKGAQRVSGPIRITVGARPTNPTDLAATEVSRTEIGLTWKDNAANETGYEVYQVVNGSTHNLLGTLGEDVQSTTVTGLQPGTQYTFVVRAFNPVGFAESATVTASTLLNGTPVANADHFTAVEDSVLSVVAGVLANDTDPDGDSLSALLVDGPAHGHLILNRNGSFDYTPVLDYYGQDAFSYQASDGFSSSLATVTITVAGVNDPPTAPTNLAASASSGLVTLSWAPSADPDGDPVAYAIYRSVTSGTYGSPIATVPGSSYEDKTVNNGTKYFYQVVALDLEGNYAASGEVSATPDVVPVNVYVAQNPIVTGTASGDYTATFGADNVTQSITEVATSTGARLQADYTLVSPVKPVGILSLSLFFTGGWTSGDGAADPLVVSIRNQTSGAWEQITADIQDGEFIANIPKDYISSDGVMQVRFTDTASIKREKKDTLKVDQLFAQFIAGAPDTTAPVPPSGLNATPGDAKITLNWTANTETDLAGYKIYRAAEAGEYSVLGTATSNAYVDSGVVNGTTYRYQVTAVDQSGNESGFSISANAVPVDGVPAAPTGLTATTGDTQVYLNWDDSTDPGLLGYNVYMEGWAGALNTSLLTVSDCTITGLANGQTFTFYVTAVDGAGESARSVQASATPVAQTAMHVESIAMGTPVLNGKNYRTSGTVSVVNSSNSALGATSVTAEWWLNSSLLQTQTAVTGANGSVTFTSPPVNKSNSGSLLTLRVTDAVLTGYGFVPTDGVTERSVPIP